MEQHSEKRFTFDGNEKCGLEDFLTTQELLDLLSTDLEVCQDCVHGGVKITG